MRKDEQAIMNKLVQVAESYNIDVGITHNKTDAEYCADKIATIREVASVLGITTDIDLKVEGNKIQAEFGSIEFYVESQGSTKYIYTKGIFGGWSKTTLKTENDQTAFIDLIGKIERDDFVFKSIGYYEMTPEKLEERDLEFMSLKFTSDGVLMDFRYNENLYYTILLTEFGRTKVTLPK